MHAISVCPRCQRQVSIPDGVDSAAQVRCPLCNAEYPLCESLPPELIPVVAASHAAASVAGLTLSVTAQRRRRAPKPWWQRLIGHVVAGLVGCLVGYYILAACLGTGLKSQGFPVLTFLPGISWLTTSANQTDAPSEKPAVNKSDKNGKLSERPAF